MFCRHAEGTGSRPCGPLLQPYCNPGESVRSRSSVVSSVAGPVAILSEAIMAPRGRTKHARVGPSSGGPPQSLREGRSTTRAASISSAISTKPAAYSAGCPTSRRQIARPARRACWSPASPRGSITPRGGASARGTPTARPVGPRLRPRRPEPSIAGGEGRLRPRAAEGGEAAEGRASSVQAGPGPSQAHSPRFVQHPFSG
jgi:hypothetical protein